MHALPAIELPRNSLTPTYQREGSIDWGGDGESVPPTLDTRKGSLGFNGLSRRASGRSSICSSVNSSIENIDETLTRLKSHADAHIGTLYSAKSALVSSIISRRTKFLSAPLGASGIRSTGSKDIFRTGSRRLASTTWSIPSMSGHFEGKSTLLLETVPMIGTDKLVRKQRLKNFFKSCVNVFILFNFLGKALKNKIERGWEFDVKSK